MDYGGEGNNVNKDDHKVMCINTTEESKNMKNKAK